VINKTSLIKEKRKFVLPTNLREFRGSIVLHIFFSTLDKVFIVSSSKDFDLIGFFQISLVPKELGEPRTCGVD
jgi:hypothetical protein